MTPRQLEIIEAVADVTGVSVDAILGPGRVGAIADARHIAMFLIKAQTRVNPIDVGRMFGRDHSSVWYAFQKVTSLKSSDEAFRRLYMECQRRASLWANFRPSSVAQASDEDLVRMGEAILAEQKRRGEL